MIQGTVDKTYRYIFTKVDGKPQFLVMRKCNLCPYLINGFKKGEALCGKYINVKSSFVDKNFISKVHGYIQRKPGTQNMDILSMVDIPFWCGLPNHLTQISHNGTIHTIKDGKIFLESGQNYANLVQVKDASFVEYDDKHESLITKVEKPTHRNYATSTGSSWKSKYLTLCSFCGKEKDEVDRNNHLGMCDSCWDKNKFSHPKRHTSFINNFRLKRKEDWKNETFKIVNK